MTIRVLALCGSLRAKSTNRGLIRYAQAHAPDGMKIHCADLLDVPFYNADLAAKPAAVETLLNEFAAADALLLACPEYNYSLAPALKNALDWASRAQYHLRQVCVYLDLHPLNKPEVFANAFSGAFDHDGDLIDVKIQDNVRQLLQALADWQQRLQR